MKFQVHYDELPTFGRKSLRADITVGVLGLAGHGETKKEALATLMWHAHQYEEMIKRAIEVIEAEIKENAS